MDHKRGCSQPRLENVLADRKWIFRTKPFRHLVSREVFKPDHYEVLENAFQALLKKGLSETPDDSRFSRNMSRYDAYGYCFRKDECGPFEIFVQQQWHDLFTRSFNVPTSGDVEICLHHHKPGGKSGQVHNDFNDAWFPDKPPDTINIAADVHTKPSKPPKPGQYQHLVIRAIAIIFFLNNEPWQHGDGGETGFYSYTDQPVDDPDRAIPPRNNTLLAFECTPFSYHSFISNVRHTRNSLIMWLHREHNEACSTWGAENIMWWPQ